MLGGQEASAGERKSYDPAAPSLLRFAGGRASRRLERYTPTPDGPGSWTLDPDFLGDSEADDRTMHYALHLPNKQILIVNGGNHDFFGGVLDPILLTGEAGSRSRPTTSSALYTNGASRLRQESPCSSPAQVRSRSW